MRKKRALSSEGARKVRQQGYDDALEFALCIGLDADYKNDPKAKKDVIDPSGDAHSVKGGEKKWQIFLYGLGRFESDDAFRVMNGIGGLLINCIKAFPEKFADYQGDKQSAKERLRQPMRELKEKLQDQYRLRAFLNKSLFNGGEVDYLTVKHKDVFHVFSSKEIITVLGNEFEVCNSGAKAANQTPEQKILFRYKGLNVGEVEMRNDSLIHYREIRFNMVKPKIMQLLLEKIPFKKEYSEKVLLYGIAPKLFGRWK